MKNDLFYFQMSPDVSCHDSVSGFALLVGIFIGIESCETGLKLFAITAEIQKYKSVIKKGEKLDKIVLIALNSAFYCFLSQLRSIFLVKTKYLW